MNVGSLSKLEKDWDPQLKHWTWGKSDLCDHRFVSGVVPGMHCGHKQGLPVLLQEAETIQTSISVNSEMYPATNHWVRAQDK